MKTMNKLDKEIADFIKHSKAATIACINGKETYCFTCFYVLLEEKACIVFKSSLKTKHGPLMLQEPFVSGTIHPDQLKMTAIKGIQFTGELLEENHPLTHNASVNYYLHYPLSAAMDGRLWVIQLNWIKFTDNTRGFGFKQHWNRENNAD